ncbi:Kelch domain-containing protein 3 [Oopsacas minuta]|uniref:Kelch domain-containing protein 3 n=1 Tax=Oopsacas minuta TaxID=111878 RepID=A0AAV7K2T8_9METZ|nr:Kelch domain-containing protein 3 [Oopsacas minuta]
MVESSDPNWRELNYPGFPPRVNHSSACDYENYIIYSSGGFYVDAKAALEHNPMVELVVDIYQLKLRDFNPKWEMIYPNTAEPKYNRHTMPRHGHCMFLHKGKLVLIGGNGNNRRAMDVPAMLSVFNLETGAFEENVKQRGHIPIERDTHACCQVGDLVYMHGGIERNHMSILSTFSNELYSLDMNTYRWMLYPALGCSNEVHLMFHSLNYHNDRLYAFGGEYSPGDFFSSEHSNKVHYYDLQKGEWNPVVTQGVPPAPRRSHITLKFRGNLVVFGGACKEAAAFYNDIFFFNLQTNTWTEVIPSGKRPIARRRCGYSLIDDSLYIFGGITPHPDTVSKNTLSRVFYHPHTENMIDLHDMHVLSLDPTLKSLSMLTVLKNSLDESVLFLKLPFNLRKDYIKFKELRNVDQQNSNIIACPDDFVTHEAM